MPFWERKTADNQISHDLRISDSSSPRQFSNTDLQAFNLQIAQALTDASATIANAVTQAANQKPKDSLVVKISLFLSIVSLISTTFGAIVLYRAQAETNIQYSLAHLTLDMLPSGTCSSKNQLNCFATFAISNRGPDTASKITVSLLITDIGTVWRSSIKDMNAFTISTSPASKKVEKQLTYESDSVAYAKIAKNNAYELMINSLPPKGVIQFSINLSPHIPVMTDSMSLDTTLYIVPENAVDYSFDNSFPIKPVIQKYLDRIFSIANFEVTTTCENCENDPDPMVVNTSSLEKGKMEAFLNAQNTLDSIWMGSVAIAFERPTQSVYKFIGNPLYLWTQPDNPNALLDSSTQAYLGAVTTCKPSSQIINESSTCIPLSNSSML